MKAKKNFAVMSAAVVMATFGLLLAACNMHWICGTFKVADHVAEAVVKGVEIGSWAAFVAAIATCGVIGTGAWSLIKFQLWRLGRNACIA